MTVRPPGAARRRAVHEMACALSLGAAGLTYTQAGVELLIDHDCWLHRADFTAFITIDDSPASPLAFIDWPAAVAALHAGQLPCSGGERRMLQVAASIAGAVPVDLSDALPGLDRAGIALVATAVLHAAGHGEQVVRLPPDVRPRPGGGPPR